MPPCRHLCCFAVCLATVAAGPAPSDVDASVLVQSVVQTHGERKPRQAPAGLGGVLDAAVLMLGQSLAQPVSPPQSPRYSNGNEEGIELTRTMSETMTGAYVTMVAARSGCIDCPFTWGDKVDLQSVVHLPENIQGDDKVSVTVDMGLEAGNADGNVFQLLGGGEPLRVHGLCGICGGSCHLKSARASDNIAVTFPTFITDSISCGGDGKPLENVTDVIVMDRSVLMPFDYYALQLTGRMNVSMAVVRDQRRLASSTLSLMIKPQTSPFSRKAVNLLSTAETPPTLPGFLQLLLGSVIGEESSEVTGAGEPSVNLMEVTEETEADPMPTMPDPVNAIITNLEVRELEHEAGNISISSSDDNCHHTGNRGTVGCVHKIGAAPSRLSTSLHLASTFEPGSYIVVRVEPKVRGLVGAFKRFTESLEIGEFEVPLCGSEAVEFEYKGVLRRYAPPPCGFYSLDVDMPKKDARVPLKVRLPALPVFDRFLAVNKYVPLSVFPPMSVDVHLQMFRPAAVPIMDVKLNMALDWSAYANSTAFDAGH